MQQARQDKGHSNAVQFSLFFFLLLVRNCFSRHISFFAERNIPSINQPIAFFLFAPYHSFPVSRFERTHLNDTQDEFISFGFFFLFIVIVYHWLSMLMRLFIILCHSKPKISKTYKCEREPVKCKQKTISSTSALFHHIPF